jgi:hypothetical protein
MHHRNLDARSLALHRLVADRLRREPEALSRAHATLARWRLHADARVAPYLADWDVILAGGVQSCIDVMLEDSERAAALRQASPFAGLLSNAERFAALNAWREKQSHAAA